MEKTLISLMGIHEQGKTETLKYLEDKLANIPGAIKTIIRDDQYLRKIKIQIDVIIIIILDGDYADPMVDAIAEAVNVVKYDIVFCRSCYLQLHSKVNDYTKKKVPKAGYRVFRTTNYSIPDQKPGNPLHPSLNKHSADQLFETTMKIISGVL